MIGTSSELREAYGQALRAFLAGGGESVLKRAYELGRRAVNEGMGLLSMVLLHEQAAGSVLAGVRSPSRAGAFTRAMEFLAECLSPFEMAHRGFQDAYARVRELNEKYEALVAERTRELRNAEAKYRAHVEQMPAITYIESLKTGDTVYISPQIEALLGFTQQEWLAERERWAGQLHAADRDRVLSELSRFRTAPEGSFRLEYRLLTRGGREVWVRHEATRVRDDAGRPLYVQGILLDTTDHKLAERIGRESEARFRKIFRHSADAIVLAALQNGRILDGNDEASSLFGLPRQELVSLTLPELFPDETGRLRGYAERVLEEGSARSEELRFRNRRGEPVLVELASSIIEIDGTPCLLCIIRDITERRRMEQLKNEFISMVSHELRTPLTSIRGSLGLIAAGAVQGVPETTRSLVDIAHRNCERLARLVNDILDIQKVESGTLTLRNVPVAVLPLLEQAIAANREVAKGYGVSLVLGDVAPSACVCADGDRLIQVLTNLLSNAARFSPAGERVVLSVARKDGMVRVSVRDFGPGIPEEFRPRVFQKFSQAEPHADGHKGSGLGLSISKGLIERMGGRLAFETQSGKGTTFSFELPECPPAGPLPGAARSGPTEVNP